MANVVVAVGTVLAVLGGWAVYFGYTIVQVERGWATLIAGAVVASGGVVTVALGLVLRRLTAMQAALRPRATLRPPVARVESGATEPQLELALAPPASPRIDRMIEPALSPLPSPDADFSKDIRVAYPDEAYAPSAVGVAADPAARDDVDHTWAAVHAELQRTDWSTLPHTPDATPEPPLADAIVPHEPAHALAEPHEFEAPEVHAEPPSHPDAVEHVALAAHAPPFAHEPKPEPVAPVAEPVSDDDYGDLLGHPKAAPTPDHPAAAPEPTAVAVNEDPVLPHDSASPHVVGKYEADGTTYSMFSDGSIEAHSPDGLYHFGSMAELKAFIEQGV